MNEQRKPISYAESPSIFRIARPHIGALLTIYP